MLKGLLMKLMRGEMTIITETCRAESFHNDFYSITYETLSSMSHIIMQECKNSFQIADRAAKLKKPINKLFLAFSNKIFNAFLFSIVLLLLALYAVGIYEKFLHQSNNLPNDICYYNFPLLCL